MHWDKWTHTHLLYWIPSYLWCVSVIFRTYIYIYIERERERGRKGGLANENTWGGVSVARLECLRWEEAFEDCPEAALVPGVCHSASVCDLTWGDRHNDDHMMSSVFLQLIEMVMIWITISVSAPVWATLKLFVYLFRNIKLIPSRISTIKNT